MLLAVGLFFVVPVGLTSLIKDQLGSPFLFWLVEGVLRTGIFIGYIAAISRLKDLRRVFEYHGAEHKTISCYEAEDELTPARAKLYSRLHPRCGTSFLLIVMVLAIFVFAPLGLPAWYWLVASRILGIPLIAGLSYEVIKWAGKNRRKRWVRAVMWPGLMLQNLTTREPDEEQLAVAIASLEAVLARESPEEAAGEQQIEIVAVAEAPPAVAAPAPERRDRDLPAAFDPRAGRARGRTPARSASLLRPGADRASAPRAKATSPATSTLLSSTSIRMRRAISWASTGRMWSRPWIAVASGVSRQASRAKQRVQPRRGCPALSSSGARGRPCGVGAAAASCPFSSRPPVQITVR